MADLNLSPDYAAWLKELKGNIRSTQIRAAQSASSVLIDFYFDLGRMIAEKDAAWGSKFLEVLSSDLKREFPNMQGFSLTNLKYCRLLYNYIISYPNKTGVAGEISPRGVDELGVGAISPPLGDELGESAISPRGGGELGGGVISPQGVDELSKSNNYQLYQRVRKMPWGHIKLLIGRIKNKEEALFYIERTLENGWNRDVLAAQIKSNLYARYGKSVTNFQNTLPAPQSELAQQIIKDPYTFDFMTMTHPYNERDIENQLVNHITKLLLELGKGFAFIGQQFHLQIDETDYFIDLLFYHIRLNCYVVVELKNSKFKPEHAGKLNFYLSAVDSLLKDPKDQPSIGILLCRDKNKVEAEFSLRDINKPIGVSEYTLTETLPDNLKGSLPTVEEIEADIERMENGHK